MDTSQELKQLFTSYWSYLALKTACKFSIFDWIEQEVDTAVLLKQQLNVDLKGLSLLLDSLLQLGFLVKNKTVFQLTEKGTYLTKNHPKSLKNACILWGEEHLTAWQNLDYTIKTGLPAFDNCYGKPFFDYLKKNESSNRIYHQAMYEYARDDYANIATSIDFSVHQVLMDVGGGLGALLMDIQQSHPQISLYLFEVENVIRLLPPHYSNFFSVISGDFFQAIPPLADGIILSRVIHDWNDTKAKQILSNVYDALPHNGRLYLIEILKDQLKDAAALLSLNMYLICDSYERTKDEYKKLLEEVGFVLLETKPLNTLQSIIICY